MSALDDQLLDTVAAGAYHDPHSVLGIHPGTDARGEAEWTVRARRPLAKSVTAVFADGTEVPLEHVRSGIWEGVRAGDAGRYHLVTTYGDGPDYVADDPYRHPPVLGEIDMHLIREGRHEQLWKVLGAHVREHDGAWGTSFTVWAPNARAARVVGDFNSWDGSSHSMRSMGSSGVWELFIPAIGPGSTYKYELLTRHGGWITKADPMAQFAEVPPATASVVVQSQYSWKDADWLARRASTQPLSSPMSVYELHFASWRPGLSYRDAADQLIDYVTEQGFTHIEFMPLAEHPFGGSWGYQVTGYFAATSRFGHPDDLRYLIDRLHQADIGVIMDWVPGHFPKDSFALARFDGEPLYEHPDPRRGEHRDWGTLHLRLRPSRGAQLPRRQRSLLVRGVPHRRAARRRRRLDAVPRLLARRGRMDPQRPRRP